MIRFTFSLVSVQVYRQRAVAKYSLKVVGSLHNLMKNICSLQNNGFIKCNRVFYGSGSAKIQTVLSVIKIAASGKL